MKERLARKEIEEALATATKPAMMLSFGKDSLVLAHLLTSYGVRRAFFVPHADDVRDTENRADIVGRYELEVTELSLGALYLAFLPQALQLVNLVPLTPSLAVPFFWEIGPYDGSGPLVCVDELMQATHGRVTPGLEVDLLFWGNHRSDPLAGGDHCLPVYRALSRAGQRGFAARGFPSRPRQLVRGVTFSSPLFGWTPKDVWAFIDEHGLPFSRRIYGAERRAEPIRGCFRCHDPREAAVVECPKIQSHILSRAVPAEVGFEQLRRLGILSEPEAKELSHG